MIDTSPPSDALPRRGSAPRRRPLATALLCLAVATLSAFSLSASALAAAPLSWSSTTPAGLAAEGPVSISCPNAQLCIAVDAAGRALTSTNPSAATPTWRAQEIDPSTALNAISCTSQAFCLAVDEHGDALLSTDPSAPTPHWSTVAIDPRSSLTSVSCVQGALCLAVDEEGNVLSSPETQAAQALAWQSQDIDGHTALTSISCATATLCLAVDQAGNALASTQPGAPAAEWSATPIDADPVVAVSCEQTGACVALDADGRALASADPFAPDAAHPHASGPTWSKTAIDPSHTLSAIACAASQLCVAITEGGHALASDDPDSPSPEWSATQPPLSGANKLHGLACGQAGICFAAAAPEAGSGQLQTLLASVPAPLVTTGGAAEVTETQALLTGTIDPQDALLSQCGFLYGTSTAYGASVTCTAALSPLALAQPVSALLTGLQPGVTYHYRLTAATDVQSGAGADLTFATASAPPPAAVVYPKPSIAGIPSVGETLTCVTHTPADVPVTLAYAWLRDTKVIARSKHKRYTVKGTDSGHHLQCRATATDAAGGATQTSGFVTIPRGGVPAAVGETSVGAVSVTGNRVFAPITCSPRVAGRCKIELRLTVLETLKSNTVVAVSASAAKARKAKMGRSASASDRRSKRARASARAPRARRVTVTIGRAHSSLAPGAKRRVGVRLNAAGKSLLRSHKSKLRAQLTVTGTIIGVISGTLRRQQVSFSPAGHLSRHARSASSHERHLPSPARLAARHARAEDSSQPRSVSQHAHSRRR